MRRFGIVIIVSAALATGCSPPVADTSEGSASSDPSSLTDQECTLLSNSATATAGFAVLALEASGGCEGGVLVTTAGVATPICVIPLAVSALAAITAAVEAGVAVLSCSNGAQAPVRPTTSTGSTASDAWCEQLSDSYHSWCAEPHRCNAYQSCAQLGDNIRVATRCRDQRQQYADQCYGSADDGHQQAIDAADQARQNCIAYLAYKQQNSLCE